VKRYRTGAKWITDTITKELNPRYGELTEHLDGEWVKAEIAVEMYELLYRKILPQYLGMVNTGKMSEDSEGYHTFLAIKKVLGKARGE